MVNNFAGAFPNVRNQGEWMRIWYGMVY